MAALASMAFLVLAGLLHPLAGPVRAFWAAQTATGTPANPRYATAGDTQTLKSGDRIQFYIASAAPAHAYLLNLRPDGTIEQLLPKPGTPAALAAGDAHYLPARGEWYVLDKQPGREFMFLLVAAEPLPQLDAALRDYAAAPPAERKSAAAAVTGEIGRLRAAYPPSTPASRPTTIAGTMRAGGPDPAASATEITAPYLYARTYIIDHK